MTSGVLPTFTAADRADQLERARQTSDGSGGLRTGGRAYCRVLSDLTDAWVQQLFTTAVASHPDVAGRVALLAVGGYGRGELAPFSDLDLLLVYDIRSKKAVRAVEPIASALWYPMWDAGFKLGHAVRSVKEQMTLAADDLDSATALLTARPLAGDESLAAEVIAAGRGVVDHPCGTIPQRPARPASANAKTKPVMLRTGSNPTSSRVTAGSVTSSR